MNENAPSPDEEKLRVFFGALEREDPEAREHYLDSECGTDSDLRRWVDSELKKQTSSSSDDTILDPIQISPETEALMAALKPEERGDVIGRYKLIEMLGEGGFGVVWMAEQSQPVRREVAMKILKPGMDSRQIIGRFEQERQALARLDHPGVAKILDAGATATGRPFFVMELVRGEPITDFCDRHRYPILKRLELMIRVCHAVQHAHQKAIIHRDIKPSNLLVTELEGGLAIPKVIDLGLAKVTQEVAGDHTLVVTRGETMLGTPLYMSPEQADGSNNLDTRSDIYSLGVTLYELLTGTTPHKPGDLTSRSDEEIRRAIREKEAPPPSSALRSLGPGPLSAVAQHRESGPAQLIQSIKGELDAICLKSLEKDPRRRYVSAAALAADLQHFLQNEPITARPPSGWYRMAKFTSRHRHAVAAVSLIVVAIVIGSALILRQALRAKEAEERAEEARAAEVEQREAAEEQRSIAEQERSAARLNEYVANLALAQAAIEDGNLERAHQLLAKHRPLPGKYDLRGWGWRYLWRLAMGDPHTVFPRHSGPVRALAYSPEGDLLATAGPTGTTVQDAYSRERLMTFPEGATTLAWSADGQLLIGQGSGKTHAWRRSDWKEETSSEPAKLPEPARPAVGLDNLAGLDRSGPWALAGQGGLVVAPANRAAGGFFCRIWDAKSGHELGALPIEHRGFISALAVFPDGNTLATASFDHSVRVWDLAKRQRLALWQGHPAEVGAAVVSPDGRQVVTGDRSGEVFAWSWPAPPSLEVIAEAARPLAFSPDGRTLAVVRGRKSVALLDTGNLRTLDEIPLDPAPADGPPVIGVTAELQTIAQGLPNGDVKLWRRGEDATVIHSGAKGQVAFLAFSADGEELAIGCRGEQVRWKDLRTGGEAEVLPIPSGPLFLSPDGSLLAVLPLDARDVAKTWRPILLWDVSAGALRARLEVENGVPFAAAFSPDGRVLATGGSDDQISLWGTGTGVLLGRCAGHRQMVRAVAFTDDGRTVASASDDGTLRLWNVSTQREMLNLENIGQYLGPLCFSPEGRTLAVARTAADASTSVRLYRAPLLEEADREK